MEIQSYVPAEYQVNESEQFEPDTAFDHPETAEIETLLHLGRMAGLQIGKSGKIE